MKTKQYLPGVIVLTLLGAALLSACSGSEGVAQAQALPASLPATLTDALPTSLPTLFPTPTAAVFEWKPTSTSFPTFTPIPTFRPMPTAVAHESIGPQNFPAGVDPLTGLTVSDPQLLERRPVAVKVTNFPRAVRPQWGLTQADQVYEYYLEDLITRFIGVFYGQNPTRIGPVRSGRFFDEHIVRMYKSFFVFGWADDRVVDPWTESDLKNFLVVERGDNCPPMCRIGPKGGYNTLYVDLPALETDVTSKEIDNARQDLNGFLFDKIPPFSPKDVWQIYVRYSAITYNRWDYDPLSGRYKRYQEAGDAWQAEDESYRPLSDSGTGQQIAADNLVVLLIPHEYFMNTKTTEMVKMNFIGKGVAYVFRDGKIYPTEWTRAKPEELVKLIYPDGNPFPLKPGQTWFEVIGESSAVKQQADGAWRFEFAIP